MDIAKQGASFNAEARETTATQVDNMAGTGCNWLPPGPSSQQLN
jgi:hypothetical protein